MLYDNEEVPRIFIAMDRISILWHKAIITRVIVLLIGYIQDLSFHLHITRLFVQQLSKNWQVVRSSLNEAGVPWKRTPPEKGRVMSFNVTKLSPPLNLRAVPHSP